MKFDLSAEKIRAKVFGGPKYTVSPIYEGMLKEETDAAVKRHPKVRYEPQLTDATYALLLTNTDNGMVIPSLNRSAGSVASAGRLKNCQRLTVNGQ